MAVGRFRLLPPGLLGLIDPMTRAEESELKAISSLYNF